MAVSEYGTDLGKQELNGGVPSSATFSIVGLG
jgi:hypothetical protein